MNAENINIDECIAIAFSKSGYKVDNNSNDFIFTPLNLKINGILEDISEDHNGIQSVIVKIELTNGSKFSKPIYEYGYGWGNSSEEAIVNALERWIESDFPVIHDWLTDHKLADQTNELKIMSHVGVTNEIISWKGILGPLISFENNEVNVNKEDQNTIFKILLDDITTDFLNERGQYPIKCFLSKSNESIQVDCRLNGKIWERGYLTLQQYGQNWEVDTYQYLKQYFVVFDQEASSEDHELKSSLLQEVEKISNKKWWEFWK